MLLTAVPFSVVGATRRLPDTYHSAGSGRGTATLKFYGDRDILAGAHRPRPGYLSGQFCHGVGALPGSPVHRTLVVGRAQEWIGHAFHTDGVDGHAFGPAAAAPSVRSSELLGFPADARVLIINLDDFGMYHAVNAAVVFSIEEGIASSCSLMVPCPWALHAMHLLRQKPEIPFGIHLTLFCDTTYYRWGPLSAREKVASLLAE